jgi:hypothetical protein
VGCICRKHDIRKEYPTFEELWTCCAQEESRISAKEKPQKKYDDSGFTARSRMKETSSSEGNNTLLISCTYLVCIVSVHILYIYLLEDNVFQEELYLWKNNKIRIDIIKIIHMKG